MGKINTYNYDGEYVSWTTDGVYAGTVFYRNEKFSITNICGLLQLKTPNIKHKFLYYMLSMLTYKYVNPAMGNAKLMSNVMASIEIPIPPLDIQEYIINILDKFDTLVNDISNGIPAEIELTKKLYKGYLKELLTFQAKE